MRIVYAIILAVSLIGCDDGKKKEAGDKAVGGGPGGAGADGGQGGRGMSGGGNTRSGRKSGSGQTGGSHGGSSGLSTDEAAIDQKIAQLEKEKIELNGKIANAEKGSPTFAQVGQVEDALIEAVLRASIPELPRLPTEEQLRPFVTAVNAVPDFPSGSVFQSGQRTEALTQTRAALQELPTERPTGWTRAMTDPLQFLIAAIEREIAAPDDDNRPGMTQTRKTLCLQALRPQRNGFDVALEEYRRAFDERTPDPAGQIPARTNLLTAIEQLDPSHRAPVVDQFQEYIRVKQAAGAPQTREQAESALVELRRRLADIDSQIAAEKAKKK